MKKVYSIGLALLLFCSAASAAPVAGDYRSDLLTGDWGNTLTWLRFNGIIWLTDLSYPGQNSGTGNVEITAGRTVILNVSPANPIGSLTITSGTLVYNSTTGRTLSVTGNVIFAGTGNMSVTNATGTNAHTLNIAGSITMANGTSMDMSTGDDVANVVLNGSGNQSITINGTTAVAKFYDLTINKSTAATTITSSVNPFTVKHDLNITSGNLILEATADLPYTIQNNLNLPSGSKLTHNISYNNANKILYVGGDLAMAGNYVYTGYLPAICMNGSGNRVFNTGTTALCKLFLLNGDFKANGNVTVNQDFYAMWDNNAGSFHTNGQTVAAVWGLVNSGGTLYVDGGSLTVGTTSGGLLIGRTNGVNGNVVVSSGSLISPNIYIGNAASTPPTTTAAFALSGGTITSNLIDVGFNSSFTKSGGSNDVATLTVRTATSSYNNDPAAASTLKVTNFTNNGLYTSGGNSTIEVTGQWVNNGTFSPSAGSSVIFKGTSAQTISGSAATTFHHLSIQPTAGITVTAGNNIVINGNLEVASGTLDLSTYTCNRATTGGTLSLAAATTLKMSGTSGGACSLNNFPANFSNYAFNITSNAIYAAAGNQQICSAPVYGNLLLQGAGTKIAASGTIAVKGNFINTAPSVFSHNNGTISIEGTANQDLAGVGYYNLTVKNGAIKTLTAAGSVAKELNIGTSTTFALANNNLTLVSTAANTANIAEIPTGATITYGTGRFVVERYINTGMGVGQHKKSWQLVSTPAVGQTIYNSWQEGGSTAPGFGTWITGPGTGVDAYSAGPSVKYYDPATDYYIGVANTNTPVVNKNGYFLYVRGDRTVSGTMNPTPTVLRMTGKVYQPNDAAPSVTVGKGKYTSVGNPYASAIDINFMKLNSHFTNLNYDVIVWDPGIGGHLGYGGWQTLSAANNYEPVIGGQPSSLYPAGVSSPYIQSGQAFFVHSANGATTDGILSFAENVKSNNSRLVTRGSSGRQYFRTALFSNEEVVDGNAIAFDEDFSNTIDADDALKIPNTGENFGLLRNGKNLSVEARAFIKNADTVFYNMTNLRQQAYQLRFAPKALPAGMTVFLKDRFMDTFVPLSNTDSSFINFTVSSISGSYAADRFYVVFKMAGVLPVKITSVSASRKQNRQVEVKWIVEDQLNIKNYVVEHSSDGRSFSPIAGNITATNVSEYTKMDEHALVADNYYRIRIVDLDGKTNYSSIVKVTGEKTAASISVYPNPVEGKLVQVYFVGQPEGNYSLQLNDQRGRVIASTTVNISGTNSTIPLTLPATTPAGIYALRILLENGKTSVRQVIVK